MDFIELSEKRFTAKKYDPTRKISEENFAKLKKILQLSPSSINSQPWVFITGTSDKFKDTIRPAVFDFNHERTDSSSHIVILAVRDGLPESYMQTVIDQEIKDGRIVDPSMAKELLAQRMYFVNLRNDQGETLNWEAKQTYIAMTTLLYGARSLGIDSTPIEGFEPEQLDRLLGLDKLGLHSVLMVSLGYGAEEDHNRTRPKSRLPESEIFIDMDARL